jgi:hypothetical protein
MKTLSSLNRRSFLRMLFLLGLWVPTRSQHAFVATDGSHADLLSAKLLTVFHDQESARAVGLEYLRLRSVKTDAQELIKQICASWNEPQIAHATTETIKALLQNRQRDDFEKDRIVKVRGWILSETEARLCALAALV